MCSIFSAACLFSQHNKLDYTISYKRQIIKIYLSEVAFGIMSKVQGEWDFFWGSESRRLAEAFDEIFMRKVNEKQHKSSFEIFCFSPQLFLPLLSILFKKKKIKFPCLKYNLIVTQSLLRFRADYASQLEIVFNTFLVSSDSGDNNFLSSRFSDLKEIKVHLGKLFYTKRDSTRGKNNISKMFLLMFLQRKNEEEWRKCYRFQQSILNNELGFL